MFVFPNIVVLRVMTLLLGSSLLLGAGCSGNTRSEKNDGLEKYAEQSNSVLSPDLGNKADNERQAVGEWSIVLTSIASGRMEHATALLEAIQNKGGLPRAYIDERSEGLVIAYGRYTGSDDKRARADLTRIREMTINEGRPYVGAFLAPPSGIELMGSNPKHDLRTVKTRLGERAVYTLQIGVYGSDDYRDPSASELEEYRKSAEKAVAELRADGEQAFYYHAATRSMVTVGVFSRDDHDATVTPPMESTKLRATREKFPNNTLNGLGIRETVRTEQGKRQQIQRSQLVEIPKR